MGDVRAQKERSESTPATREFWQHVEADDWSSAIAVLAEHWTELWYATDPTDLRTAITAAPREIVRRHPNACYLASLLAVDLGATAADSARVEFPGGRLEQIAQQVADLRLAGRPAEAMARVDAAAGEVRALRGSLVDGTGGRVAVWAVQGGITALLAGQLPTARAFLTEATTVHRPERFPFIRREAAAKLALAHAVGGTMGDAQAWVSRARDLPRSRSWVESFVDDSVWLTDYMSAVACLDLERAEEMRLERPSPVQHAEFWCIALGAYVDHLVLTGRAAQAAALCDETEALGLPLPDSDGVPRSAVRDARMAAEGLPGAMAAPEAELTPRGVLARRRRLFETGQFEPLTYRAAAEIDARADGRTRLALRLLRAQAVMHAGSSDQGQRLLLGTLEEIFELGLLSVLQHLDTSLLEGLDDRRAQEAVELVRERKVTTPVVVPLMEAPLSPAEVEVLRLLSLGMSRPQIAERLFVSVNTIKSQLASAYTKLGVTTRAQALARIDQLGL